MNLINQPDKRLLTPDELNGAVFEESEDGELFVKPDAYLEVAKTQLTKDLISEQARVEGIFKEIEVWLDKEHIPNMVKVIRATIFWQALKKQEGIE